MPILVVILTVGMITAGSSISLVYAGSENSATGKGEICKNDDSSQGDCQQTSDSPDKIKKEHNIVLLMPHLMGTLSIAMMIKNYVNTILIK